MEQLKAIIIDDEKDSREIISSFLTQHFPEFEIVGEANSVKTGVEVISSRDFDLLFLDIQLDDTTSFEILNQLEAPSFKIIFITAHDEFALQAIKHQAMDYLLKPLDRKEFINAVGKFIKTNKKDNSNNIQQLIESFNKNKKQQIKIPTLSGFKIVNFDDIIYLESDSNYTQIFLHDDSVIMVSKTLKEYETLLPMDKFCRIHNSFIINTSFIKEYIKGRGGQVILKNNKKLSVSNRRKDNLLKIWD